ncbi:hypothetical protein PRIC2_000225 [Phytophthora ramorum]
MQAVVGFLAVLAVIALLFCCLSLLARRAYIRRQRSLELHAPLLNSDDRRLDAALRDAEEGFNVCAVCSFENFRRVKFCTVCGQALADDEQQNGDKKAPRLSFLPLFKRESRVQLVTATPTHQTTRRRLRAQRRKEWTRKVDVEGRTFWFRDGRWTDTRFTGFVVKFLSTCGESNGIDALPLLQQGATTCEGDKESVSEELSTVLLRDNGSPLLPAAPSRIAFDNTETASSVGTDAAEPEPEHELAAAENANTLGRDSIREQEPLLGSVEECITNLVHNAQATHTVLTTASDTTVDASKLPLEIEIGPRSAELNAPNSSLRETTTTSPPPSETIALASKDFPSKYAHFVTATSTLLVPAEREHLRLNVERANVFEDSMESLAIIPLRNLHSVLRINFLDESGVDAGGLHREWFVMLNEMLVDPARGLFVYANKNEQAYFLSPCSNMDLLPDRLLHLYAAGRLLGRALLEGSMLCFHLASPFLKLILGYPLSFEDLEDLDPEVYSNLRWLLENDNVDALDLDFTVTTKDGDSYRDIELVPGGSAIPVTDSNKREFVKLKWQYLLVESVAPQLQVFLQGLYEIVPRELLLLFDPEEFDFLLCGSDEIDVDDWERNTKYSEDLHHHRSLKWFWELVREMPNEYRRRLLQFSTGSSRVPLGGFSALTSYDGRLCPFTLKAVSLIGDGFIHSHACFNRLDLPLHVVRDELKAVLYAVLETEVYGFTTD